MENELEMSDEDCYIIEDSSSEYESELDSMNGTEDSDSNTEFDVNNSSYNVAIQPVNQAPDLSDVDIISWSKVMKKKMNTLKLILTQQLQLKIQFFVGHLMFHIGKRLTKQFQK